MTKQNDKPEKKVQTTEELMQTTLVCAHVEVNTKQIFDWGNFYVFSKFETLKSLFQNTPNIGRLIENKFRKTLRTVPQTYNNIRNTIATLNALRQA